MILPGNNRVIWITGLSGAGKTTLARHLVAQFRDRGQSSILLDGDELREVFGATAVNSINHGRQGRLALAFQYAHLCRVISEQGFTVIISTISLFREIHEWNRNNLPGYFEIYLKVPLQELRKRDPKGIYRKFDSGEISNVAGLDLSIDEPQSPDFLVDHHSNLSSVETACIIIDELESAESNDQNP